MKCPVCGHEPEMRFGEKLKIARIRSGLTMQQLADHLGYDLAEIKRWERGATKPRPANMRIVNGWIEGEECTARLKKS